MPGPPSSLGKRQRLSSSDKNDDTDASSPRKIPKNVERLVLNRATDAAAARKANSRRKAVGDFALLSKKYPFTRASNNDSFTYYKTPFDTTGLWKCPLSGCESLPEMDYTELQDHCKLEHENGNCTHEGHMYGSERKSSPNCLSAALRKHFLKVHYGAGNFICPSCYSYRSTDRIGTLVKHMLGCANMEAEEEKLRLKKKVEKQYESDEKEPLKS